MKQELDALVARYRSSGEVDGLPTMHFIAGQWTPSSSGGTMESLDPGTGKPFHAFAAGDAEDVDRAVRGADVALKGAWSRVSPAERGAMLARAAILIREAGPRLAFAETLDSGKPLQEAEGDVLGAARNVTSVLPELGGKSPVVVLRDADIDAVVDGVVGAIFENAGQICSAGSRLVVERAVHADLVERLVARARAINLGHGLRRPDMGPVSTKEQQAKIAGFVDDARDRGLEIATGGRATTDPETGLGWFYEPTIVDRVPVDDQIAQEEIFGPVLAVQVVEDAEEAVEVANSTRFALVAGVYTRDFSAAHDLARRIDAGQVYINEYFAGGIALPFGGNRMSGFGREKGTDALRTYMKLKSVAARVTPSTR
ncbi:aldehyde dehydrogenase family protein [Aquibium carbonis]|uniref:Aldehyde dehydrogenase family protein n=1 Tax=Aquibium carbonis TaxID=2495581 RepID=A0A429Z162_9HYPH|nr:aldehyde dehydrogenase family protein [Aquibium carbonis]RST87445.1 aldehyde dehydrogenase family protein [Aquibium carbonis]